MSHANGVLRAHHLPFRLPVGNNSRWVSVYENLPGRRVRERANAPLQPAPVSRLWEQIKALAPARLETFPKGFRAAFQVPDAVPSHAGLFIANRHQRWIEDFLAEVVEPSTMAT